MNMSMNIKNMTPKKRFIIGGAAALMPILVGLLYIDIDIFLSDESRYSKGHFIGMGIRYSILFLIGGFIAWLHEDEHKPFKLFEIGMAAPALITSIIAANGLNSIYHTPVENIRTNPVSSEIISINNFIISNANAHPFGHSENENENENDSNIMKHMYQGVFGSVYSQRIYYDNSSNNKKKQNNMPTDNKHNKNEIKE